MPLPDKSAIKALTFDLFRTVLDLGGSLTPAIAKLLKDVNSKVAPAQVWQEWRYRQRIEQYQDNTTVMGHISYLHVARRSRVYVTQQLKFEAGCGASYRLMTAWQDLNAFDDVLAAFEKLSKRYKLVGL